MKNLLCKIFGHKFKTMKHIVSITNVTNNVIRITYICERCGHIDYTLMNIQNSMNTTWFSKLKNKLNMKKEIEHEGQK